MKAKFYLRKKDVNDFSNIYIYLTANSKQVFANTNAKIKKEEWDSKKQLAKYDEQLNILLTQMSTAVNYYASALKDKQPTNEELAKRIANLVPFETYFSKTFTQTFNAKTTQKKVKEHTTSSFFDVIDKFIAEAPNRLNSNGEKICERRVKMYYYNRIALKEFEEKVKKELTFEGFDTSTLLQFQTFLTNKNLKNNTIVRYFKLLFVFFRYAEETMNVEVNQSFRKYKIRQNKKESVVLNEQEIEKIWKYKCDNERENNVKKLFLIGLYTGLRFGDYSSLSTKNIDFENGTISTIQNKTGQRVIIPLHPRLSEMLKNETMPHTISNEKFNLYLHQLMQKIGFNSVTEVKSVKGGKRIIEYKEKWQLISSHTARRSFATNLYKAGVNPSIIMLCTGHRDLDTFMKYVVLDDDDKLQVVRNFFNRNNV